MNKRFIIVASAAAMALVLSSCFVLQGFSVLATSLQPGGKTKAQFVMHPMQVAKLYADTFPIRTKYQFVVVGVPSSGDLAIGKATWGTNGKFGGPLAMLASGPLPAAMATSGCSANGLNFADITNTTWKGFITPSRINDKGAVDQKAVAQVVIRATSGAEHRVSNVVFGVMGSWEDDGDGTVDSGDTFACMGIATSSVYVK